MRRQACNDILISNVQLTLVLLMLPSEDVVDRSDSYTSYPLLFSGNVYASNLYVYAFMMYLNRFGDTTSIKVHNPNLKFIPNS